MEFRRVLFRSREELDRLFGDSLEVDVVHRRKCPSFDTPTAGDARGGRPADGERSRMAELTDPPSGKPLVLRVEISAENGGSLSVPALEAGLLALAPAVAPVSAPVRD